MIVSARMRLVPASVALARAELTDRAEFARLLSATVPDEWPPEILADALPVFLEWIEAAPDRVGWYVWYAMMRAPREASNMLAGDVSDILMASAGFKGPPQDGTIEIGYSVLPRFQGHGYATEMVRALIDWAFAQPSVARIVAETIEDNTPSTRLLRKPGFVETEPTSATISRCSSAWIIPNRTKLCYDRLPGTVGLRTKYPTRTKSTSRSGSTALAKERSNGHQHAT